MVYLIDTYNLIHVSAWRGGVAPTTVRGLCQALAGPGRALKVVLILDGRSKPEEPGLNEFPAIDLRYSGAGIPADRVIGQMVERSKERKKLTVVTDDRAVTLHARRHFASAMSCDAFLELLFSGKTSDAEALPARKTQGSPTSGETAHWLKEFGITKPVDQPPPRRAPNDDLSDLDIEKLLGPRD